MAGAGVFLWPGPTLGLPAPPGPSRFPSPALEAISAKVSEQKLAFSPQSLELSRRADF